MYIDFYKSNIYIVVCIYVRLYLKKMSIFLYSKANKLMHLYKYMIINLFYFYYFLQRDFAHLIKKLYIINFILLMHIISCLDNFLS